MVGASYFSAFILLLTLMRFVLGTMLTQLLVILLSINLQVLLLFHFFEVLFNLSFTVTYNDAIHVGFLTCWTCSFAQINRLKYGAHFLIFGLDARSTRDFDTLLPDPSRIRLLDCHCALMHLPFFLRTLGYQ